MKYFNSILLVFLLLSSNLFSETRSDTVVLGQGYQDMVWFNSETSEKFSAPLNDWDIAFMTGQNASIIINDAIGTELYYVKGSSADTWENAIDTTGISSSDEKFVKQYNSIGTWKIGAFNMDKDGYNTDGDYGWGDYNSITHGVNGKSVYLIKLMDGSWKKIFIKSTLYGITTFEYSNLDHSDPLLTEIDKYDYVDKMFVYYSIRENTKIDKEPAKENWDLLFSSYVTKLDDGQGGIQVHSVVGTRCKDSVQTYACFDTEPANFISPTRSMLSDSISTIGHEWKSFSMSTMQYSLTENANYWVQIDSLQGVHIVFDEFGASQTGLIRFTSEIKTLGVIDDGNQILGSIVIPNNVTQSDKGINAIVNLNSNASSVSMNIYDQLGNTMLNKSIPTYAGTYNEHIDCSGFASGMYFLVLNIDGKIRSEKFIIK